MPGNQHDRPAEAMSAEDVQRTGRTEGDPGHTVVAEGGQAAAPTEGKGYPQPATSRAHAEGSPEAGTSPATAGKTEKDAAAEAGAAKDQHGRGRRKAEAKDD